jgi:protein-tyrosine phosphatase
MALPVAHTVIGITVGFLIGLAIFLKRKKFSANTLLLTSLLMVIFGVWAEVPDIPRFLPRYEHLERKLHHSSYVNTFFFHGYLDTWEEDRGELLGSAILFSVFFFIFFAASYTILKNEKKLNELENKQDPQITPSADAFIFKDIVDIHCHVLAGLDDGPQSLEESLSMCRRALELGVVHIVATPHLPWLGEYQTDQVVSTYNLLRESLKKENLPLELSLGADIRISWDLVERLKSKSVFTIAGSRYFLLELDDFTLPATLEDFIAKCNKDNFYPVLTHPERNVLLRADYEKIKALAKLPLLIQVSSCSLTATMGNAVKKAALDWLNLGLVDIIASDAHALNMRLEEFRGGLEIAEKLIGPQQLRKLATDTPQAVIRNLAIEQLKRKP